MATDADFPSDLRALEREYELIRELGHGGVAAVYLARKRVSGRLVAIKAIRGRYLDDPDALRRFAREARTVAGLDHANIVRTEAIEQIDDRAVAIIMEHVPGGTVRDRLREHGSLGAEDAEAILRDVASALAYAHRRGIVHRDVKPENIFLDVTRGRALLSDFGIARSIDGEGGITLLGAALGTPQYMSPEQIDGEVVDGRSDIYSLGVLGWELLTGRRPWAGESLYGIIYKQKHEDLPRITSLRPRVPANLLFAIEGALIKDKTRRWQTIDAFLDQLTYNPPPVLAQTYPAGASPMDDQPTVQFRAGAIDPDQSSHVPTASTDVHAGLHREAEVDAVAPITPPPETHRESAAVTARAEPIMLVPTVQSSALGSAPRDSDEAPTRILLPAMTKVVERDDAAAPNAESSFAFTTRRRRMLQAVGLVVPLTLAAASLFLMLSGSARDGAGRAPGSSRVTTSAGSSVSDSATLPSAPSSGGLMAAPPPENPAPRISGITGGSSVAATMPATDKSTPAPGKQPVVRETRRGAASTAKAPSSRAPRKTRVDSKRVVASAKPPAPNADSNNAALPATAATPPDPDSTVGASAPIEDPFKIPPPRPKKGASSGDGAGPIPRCRIAATADQRACLAAYIEIGDAPLNRTFESLVDEMRRVAGTPLGAPDPPTVQRIRVEQRVWLGVRESECPRQAPSGGGPFWAQAQSECFAEMASARTAELRDAVRRLKRK